jgi:hypothetical protein
MDVTTEQIGEVLTSFVRRNDEQLLAMSADEIAADWRWRWEEERSAEWNAYEFNKALELHKRRWRRWEEHHNGTCCVVERVRDTYVMPRIRDFLTTLNLYEQ